ELAEELARLRVPPPVLADLPDQVPAKLGGADPRTEVVGRVEPRVHVGEVVLAPVEDAGRLGQQALVHLRVAAVAVEARPEVELEPQLRLVAPVQERLQKRRRLRVLLRLVSREAEVLLVPPWLAADRLDDVRVDLGQRVIARDAPEDVWERGIASAVVQRMAGL